ncbi:MAG TPA: ABC transporter permease [Candidatus Pacearchaeota archaeon]|nr:macrolide export ATP-binding/permease protein MacB [archaeon BMS3Abin17]HDK42212.1 ABC transporter permease [Candidatus Pacearchaeota archaeon]HDZ61070.1 ABC transporter permease [Candidatus Pacearchaeota archaeon]
MIGHESINYSLRNIRSRKSRSLLTILSIFVGIATIFIFISFGLGLYGYMEELKSGSSADKIIIQPKGGFVPGLDSSFLLSEDDLKVIKRTAGVYDASGIYWKAAEIVQDKTKKYAFLMAYDPDSTFVMDIFNIDVYNGREFNPGDDGKVLLGYNYQFEDRIFPKSYGVNSKINVNGRDMRVIGFFEAVGSPQDDSQVYMTKNYFEKLYPNSSYGWIIAKVDISQLDTIVERVEKNLRKSRDLEKGKEDFFVQSFDSLIETYSTALNIVVGFVVLIALVSVLVSVVNTANTMISSVLERVKEIGIIKSIGGRNSVIFNIFLFESAFLGFVAGVLGVLLGWLVTYLGGAILDNLGWGFLSPHYSWYLFAGCILFAVVTGAISGVIPAIKASRINPVDALRYE